MECVSLREHPLLNDQVAEAFAAVLRENTTLRTLDLSFYSYPPSWYDPKHKTMCIGDQGAKAIAEALKVNTSLKTLMLGCTTQMKDKSRCRFIGEDGKQAFVEALKVNQTCTTLRVNADALRVEKSLEFSSCSSQAKS
jgi:hypothetical protein